MKQPPEKFLNEARNSLEGTVRLFLNDRRGLEFFHFDLSGLMGSFAALILSWLLFLYAPGRFGIVVDESLAASLLRLAISQLIVYGAVALFVKIFKQEHGFLPYMVVHNWASLLLMPFQIGVLIAPESIVFFLLAGIAAFSLVFFLRTTQIILNASFGQILILIGILFISLILMVSFTGLEFWGIQP